MMGSSGDIIIAKLANKLMLITVQSTSTPGMEFDFETEFLHFFFAGNSGHSTVQLESEFRVLHSLY